MPIIAVSLAQRTALIERTGSVVSTADLPGIIAGATEPTSLWVCPTFSWLLWELDQELDSNPLWQFRAAPMRRDVYSMKSAHKSRRAQTMNTIITYMGLRSLTKKRGHWHYPLDPVVFASGALQGHDVESLLAWGRDIRAWCQEHRLNITPTAGGIAGQLLRDPRWYPQARRKVPRATNARAREVLPGNHYELRTERQEVSDAYYLDMRSAHHYCASTLTFPHADGLLARGNFRRSTDSTDTTIPESDPWAERGNPRYERIIHKSHGLLLLRLSVPTLPPELFPLPFLTPGVHLAWVYTNELPTLRTLGVSIDAIEAAWISFTPDPGLNRYAAWAQAEVATADDTRRQWLKPTQLATYGVLAARPRRTEYGYKRGEGTPRRYPAGHGVLEVRAHLGMTEEEIPTANVIQRGMIEAETRRHVLDLARDLTGRGVRVLSVYADALIVESESPLPLLPAPWAIKERLTRLRFVHPTAFMSEQMTKLPGVPREAREKAARLDAIRRIR
jgi:hypothetical protein